MYKISANTLFVGQQLVFVPECHSTNSLAAELSVKNPMLDGAVLITDHQTAGRGQQGTNWQAHPGLNLTFSVLLKPASLSITNQFYLNVIVSLAVVDFLKSIPVENPVIKWPNDVMVGKKKICGILIENSIQSNLVKQTIIGIGFNVNQQTFNYQTATSLALVTNRVSNLNETLNSLLEKIEYRYLQLRAEKLIELKKEYMENLYGFGKSLTFISKERKFNGVIKGTSISGELIVLIDAKETTFNTKEIKFVMED